MYLKIFIFLFFIFKTNGNAIYKSCDLEQPSIRLGSQRVEIKSPKFPNSFPTQTQCKWIIEAPPGRRVKITFTDWSIPPSGMDCEVVFISVTDLSLAGSLGQETKKKSVSFCGKNPGTFITSGGSIELSIHSDSDPDHLKIKHFRASISSTTDRATPSVSTGQIVSHGHVDQRYTQPPQRQTPAQRQQQAPQVYQPNTQNLPSISTQRHNPGIPVYPSYSSYPAPAQVPYAPQQAAYPAPRAPPRGNHVAPPRGGYSVPLHQLAMPSSGHAGSAGLSPPSIEPKAPKGPKFLPKNYAIASDKTREDKNGRVNTNLIKSLQQMKKDGTLERRLAKSKPVATKSASAAPIPPLGPPASSAPAPKLAPSMTSSSRGLPQPRSSVSMLPPAGYAPPIYNTAGGLAYPPVRLKSVGHQPETNEHELPQPEQEVQETQNGSAKLIVMIGIATGVITIVSGIIILLIYLHKRIKKQEKQDEVITQQKYMFDHTVLSRNATVERTKEAVNKPRDFMDEDDVEMVRTLSRSPARTTTNQNFPSSKSASSFVSSKDSGIDALSRKTKSYVTSLRS